jgi:hypothetical protein
MIKEYIISGHSDDTSETFTIPYNISIIFYANLGETCIVPHNKESLDLVVNSMKYGQFELYRQGDTIQNYHIIFNKKDFEGIALIQENNNDNNLNYDFFQVPENINSLKDLCNFIQKNNNRSNTLIYCVFCRGSKMEFEDQDFGEFNEQDIDKYLNQEGFDDFMDLLSYEPGPNPNPNLNISDNNMGIGGKKHKKKITYKKRNKHIKKTKKHKSKRRNKLTK